jgi:very-short-patch-repair endonuclease
MRRRTPEHVRQLSRELRKNQTSAEQELWSKIRNKQLGGFRFLRQYAIGRYIADFYCSKAKAVIEIDGEIHKRAEHIEYDRIRDEVIKAYGIRIIRFGNNEIFGNLNIVLEQLLDFLDLREQK